MRGLDSGDGGEPAEGKERHGDKCCDQVFHILGDISVGDIDIRDLGMDKAICRRKCRSVVHGQMVCHDRVVTGIGCASTPQK